MYRILTEDKILYSDVLRFIRLHKNGCYVQCAETDAEGICAKVYVKNEEGDSVLEDVVFVFSEGGMHGVEPLCLSVEAGVELNVKTMQEMADAYAKRTDPEEATLEDYINALTEMGVISNDEE